MLCGIHKASGTFLCYLYTHTNTQIRSPTYNTVKALGPISSMGYKCVVSSRMPCMGLGQYKSLKGSIVVLILPPLYFLRWYITDNLKPIFHWKLGLRWLQNANEINTKNMKCTCPTPAPTPEGPTPPIFHWELGLRLLPNAKKSTQKKRNVHGRRKKLASPNAKYTNMLVSLC